MFGPGGTLERGVTLVIPNGLWRSLVARFVRDEEVPGSSPGSPTNERPVQALTAPRVGARLPPSDTHDDHDPDDH